MKAMTAGRFCLRNIRSYRDAIRYWLTEDATIQMDQVVLQGNTATTSGGGLSTNSTYLTMNYVLVAANTASQNGGGLSLQGTTTTMTNMTIVGNEGGNGGGVYLNGTYPTAVNLIVYDNTAMIAGGGWYGVSDSKVYFSLAYSDVAANTPQNFYGMDDLSQEPTNASVNPVFVDYDNQADSSTWNLHLHPTSTLIDSGDPSILDPDCSTSDMGLYGGPNADFSYYESNNDGLTYVIGTCP